jgi:hypothetical protein
MAKPVPWEEIKAEYITTATSYRQLATKYGLRHEVVSRRGKAEDWPAQKDRWVNEKYIKTLEAAQDAAVTAQADHLAELRHGVDLCIKKAIEMLPKARDGRDVGAIANALRIGGQMMRDFYDIPTPAEAEARRIAAQRLEIERKKAEPEAADREITLSLSPELEEWAE